MTTRRKVSILVVLDDALVLSYMILLMVVQLVVSILVVLDDALVPLREIEERVRKSVSILVVLDDALVLEK